MLRALIGLITLRAREMARTALAEGEWRAVLASAEACQYMPSGKYRRELAAWPSSPRSAWRRLMMPAWRYICRYRRGVACGELIIAVMSAEEIWRHASPGRGERGVSPFAREAISRAVKSSAASVAGVL